MRILISVFVLAILSTMSCKDLKDQQLDAYVGDSQTKIVYKNVQGKGKAIPEGRRVGFRSQTEAIDQGYTPENKAGSGEGAPSEE